LLQRENDDLNDSLSRKQLVNETLRTDLDGLQTRFDRLTVVNRDLEHKLEVAIQETAQVKQQIAAAPHTDPLWLSGELTRLTKALESKTNDFNFVSARYQDASVSAAESAAEVAELKVEVEKLRRQVEGDVKAVSWEGEKRVLVERIRELEGRCRLLEETGRRVGDKSGKSG
jgi:hypothetical protein